MDNQHKEFRIGIMVLAALAALVFLTIYFGKQSIMSFGDEYAIRVRFQRTPGIAKNSPVFKNGVRIGRVSKVELVDQDREVEITILLPKDRKIYTDEECRVRQTVIMGDASLEFVKRANFTGKVELVGPDSPPQVGGQSTDFMSGFTHLEGDLNKAIVNVSDAATHFTDLAVQTGEVVERINFFIGSPEELKERRDRLESFVKEMRATMGSMRQLTDGANRFFNDPKLQGEIKNVVENMPHLIERSRNLVTEADKFVKDVRDLMARTSTTLDKADAGFDNINAMTAQFRGDLPNITKKLQSFLDELTTIIQGIQNADGTVKRLMRDPAVYEKLLETMDNVEQITAEVNRMLLTDIKPITYNVKIITDKVARDPSVFIRNLIRKQPPIKGPLPIWGDGLGSDTLGDLSCRLEPFRRESLLYEFDPPITAPETIPAPTIVPRADPGDEEIMLVPPNSIQTGASFGRRPSPLVPKPISALLSGNKPSPVSRSAAAPSRETTPAPTEPLLDATVRDDPVPEEGRIVHVDPRYVGEKAESGPAYRQMSYREESEETPRLIFSRK